MMMVGTTNLEGVFLKGFCSTIAATVISITTTSHSLAV